jgi:hypothetical protein
MATTCDLATVLAAMPSQAHRDALTAEAKDRVFTFRGPVCVGANAYLALRVNATEAVKWFPHSVNTDHLFSSDAIWSVNEALDTLVYDFAHKKGGDVTIVTSGIPNSWVDLVLVGPPSETIDRDAMMNFSAACKVDHSEEPLDLSKFPTMDDLGAALDKADVAFLAHLKAMPRVE